MKEYMIAYVSERGIVCHPTFDDDDDMTEFAAYNLTAAERETAEYGVWNEAADKLDTRHEKWFKARIEYLLEQAV